MSSKMISVVIPHLNQLEHLRLCLESLAQQSFDLDQVEIIVVDNGSSQLPEDVCAGFPGVVLIQETTPGPGPARNLGVGRSRGNILAFVDADCTADPGWLSAIAAALEGPGGAQVIGGDVRIARRDPQRPTMLEAYESIYAYRQEEYITRRGFSGTGNLAMRREAFDAVGPFAGIEVAEDRDWGRRATAMDIKTVYAPGMIVYHPARQSFEELCTKWDRHISHDFSESAGGVAGRLRWLGYTFAVALSPVYELIRLLRSDRVADGTERLLAFIAVIRIRTWRSSRMLKMLFNHDPLVANRSWNRRG